MLTKLTVNNVAATVDVSPDMPLLVGAARCIEHQRSQVRLWRRALWGLHGNRWRRGGPLLPDGGEQCQQPAGDYH